MIYILDKEKEELVTDEDGEIVTFKNQADAYKSFIDEGYSHEGLVQIFSFLKAIKILREAEMPEGFPDYGHNPPALQQPTDREIEKYPFTDGEEIWALKDGRYCGLMFKEYNEQGHPVLYNGDRVEVWAGWNIYPVYPQIYLKKSLPTLPVEEKSRDLLINEIKRRIGIIMSEPEGITRESMISGLLIDLDHYYTIPAQGIDGWLPMETAPKMTQEEQYEAKSIEFEIMEGRLVIPNCYYENGRWYGIGEIIIDNPLCWRYSYSNRAREHYSQKKNDQ